VKKEAILPLAYENVTAAMRDLLILRKYGGHVTSSPKDIRVLPNGLPYYFVEVTTKDGIKYVLEAYGDEAIALKEEASSIVVEPLILV
jgi:hypothetical protein